MNLAVLQADFGCFHEAVAAMLETVSTARENKDMACLNFALNWMYHFGKAHPSVVRQAEATNMIGVEREGLTYLRQQARLSGMNTLWSSTLLTEAKLGMTNGESLATAFENILKSSHLIYEKNMKPMLGPQMIMHSSLWSRLGAGVLGRQYCEVYLSAHARYGLFDDVLRHTCRLAHLMTDRGHYDVGLLLLENLPSNSLRSWKASQYFLKYRGILLLKRDLHHNNLSGASQLLTQLLQQNGADTDTDLHFEINALHIDYLIRRTDFSTALAKINQLSATIKEDGDDINLRVKLLTMKAHLQSKIGRPQKGFSVAVRAASLAWRARLIPALWSAMGAVANILTSLSEFCAAAQILMSIIPRALECENCAVNAQLYLFLVDANMGIAGEVGKGARRTEYLTRCLEGVERAFEEFSRVKDYMGQRECMAKKATILMALGERERANDAAGVYLRLEREDGSWEE